MTEGKLEFSDVFDPDDEDNTGKSHGVDVNGGSAVGLYGNSASHLTTDVWSQPALVIDGSQTVIAANRPAATLLGRQRNEIVGTTCDRLVNARFTSDEPVCRANCAATRCLAEGKSYSVSDCLITRKDGSTVRVAISTNALIGDPHDPNRPVGLVTLSELKPPPRVTEADSPVLSEREAVIVRLIALGYSIKLIARRLHISPKTVEHHRTAAGKKLGVTSRVGLVRYAISRGWISNPDQNEWDAVEA